MWKADDDRAPRDQARSPKLLDFQVSHLHAVRKIRAGGLRTRRQSVVPAENRTPTLSDAGIDKKLSSRAQKLAAAQRRKNFKSLLGWRVFRAMKEVAN
jgi:hypothetical protein